MFFLFGGLMLIVIVIVVHVAHVFLCFKERASKCPLRDCLSL